MNPNFVGFAIADHDLTYGEMVRDSGFYDILSVCLLSREDSLLEGGKVSRSFLAF